MAAITPPTCAYYEIFVAANDSNCMNQFPCLCHDQGFLATSKTYIQELCDTADQQLWTQYFTQNCPNIFSTLTTTSNSQATPTAGVASPSVAQSTSVLIVSTTLMNPSAVATTTAVGHSSVITASNTPSTSASTAPSLSASTTPSLSASTTPSPSASPTPSQATGTNSSNSGSGSGGLSTGDKAAIASTVLTAVALIIAILAWCYPEQRMSSIQALRRRFHRKPPRNVPQSYPLSPVY